MTSEQEWQLVPKKPTLEMIRSARGVPSSEVFDATTFHTWNAMLSAAPPPPASGDVLLHAEQATLAAVPCQFVGCDSPVVGIFHFPEGCLCKDDHLQALCAQHAISARDAPGKMDCVIDFAKWSSLAPTMSPEADRIHTKLLTLDWYGHREENCKTSHEAARLIRELSCRPPPPASVPALNRVWLLRAMCHVSNKQCACADRGGIVDDYDACRIVSRHANAVLAASAPALVSEEQIARAIFMTGRENEHDYEDWETEKRLALKDIGYKREVDQVYAQARAVLALRDKQQTAPASVSEEEVRKTAKDNCAFWPVGEIQNLAQIVAELRIAGQRLEIHAGAAKLWSERFYAFEAALLNQQPASPPPGEGEIDSLVSHLQSQSRWLRENLPVRFPSIDLGDIADDIDEAVTALRRLSQQAPEAGDG